MISSTVFLFDEIIHDPHFIGQVELMSTFGFPQIQSKDYRLFFAQGKYRGDVQRTKGLAFPADRRGNHKGLAPSNFLLFATQELQGKEERTALNDSDKADLGFVVNRQIGFVVAQPDNADQTEFGSIC